ncbi:MAG: 16S rRNA methyltransferase [Chloroflexi bacterium]|nr:16S rRNA methyltransferase [Chloroflexota bacterium]
MTPQPEGPKQVAARILNSYKYRGVLPELVCRVAEREWAKTPNLKQAEGSARRKLHQVAGAYWTYAPRYTAWLAQLEHARDAGPDALRAACREILAGHASTRERLAQLEPLYAETLADLAPIHSVLDLACGLNPLAAPWMPLAPEARYTAVDIYPALADFMGQALPLLGYRGEGIAADVLSGVPGEPVELVLLMKALPCLMQLDQAASSALLTSLNAPHILVTYPAASLGGRDVGMLANYSTQLERLAEGQPWQLKRWVFGNELVYRIDRQS